MGSSGCGVGVPALAEWHEVKRKALHTKGMALGAENSALTEFLVSLQAAGCLFLTNIRAASTQGLYTAEVRSNLVPFGFSRFGLQTG